MTRTEHLLSCLAEECAEVAQRASKAMRFGLDDIQEGQEHTNADRIVHELTDLCAVIEMLADELVIDLRASTSVDIERKKAKLLRYMDYATERGALTGA